MNCVRTTHKITHKSLTNHALQRIGTKRPQTGRMRGCAWRIRDGKPRIISALSLVNCVWIAHDSRMNAQEALKLRSFRAYKTDAAAVPWHSRFNSLLLLLANISWICSSWSFWFWNRSSMTSLLWGFMLDSEKLDVEEELEMWSTGEMCAPRQQDLDWREMLGWLVE